MKKIELNRIYRHFKGKYYYVKELAIDCDTQEKYVVYQALYGEHKTWIRKVNDFLEEVDKGREDNISNQKYRFELVDFDKNKIIIKK